MTAWLQLALFLLTHMPKLIASIKEIIDIFDGDAKKAKECLAGADGVCKVDLKQGSMGAVKRLAEIRAKRSGK